MQPLAEAEFVVAGHQGRGSRSTADCSALAASASMAPRMRRAASGEPAERSRGGRPRLGWVTRGV